MRILLVEDDSAVAECLGDALKMAGHYVHIAGTMAAAMGSLLAAEFDAVISDGHFPSFLPAGPTEAWGLDLLRVARRIKIRAILHSGDDYMVNQARALGLPALLKGAAIEEILAAVGNSQ